MQEEIRFQDFLISPGVARFFHLSVCIFNWRSKLSEKISNWIIKNMLLEYLFPNNHNRSSFRSYLLPSNNSLLINSLLKIFPIADSRNPHKEIFIVTSFYAYIFQRRKKRRRKRTRAICEIYRTISSTADDVRGKRDVSRAVWTRGGEGFVLVLIGGRSISWYRGFHAKGNPWPPLRSAGPTRIPFSSACVAFTLCDN